MHLLRCSRRVKSGCDRPEGRREHRCSGDDGWRPGWVQAARAMQALEPFCSRALAARRRGAVAAAGEAEAVAAGEGGRGASAMPVRSAARRGPSQIRAHQLRQSERTAQGVRGRGRSTRPRPVASRWRRALGPSCAGSSQHAVSWCAAPPTPSLRRRRQSPTKTWRASWSGGELWTRQLGGVPAALRPLADRASARRVPAATRRR